MNLEGSPKGIFYTLLVIIFILSVANALGLVSAFYFKHNYVYGLVPLFNFDTEKNIPTLYSSFALMFACILLIVISFHHKHRRLPYKYWLVLGLIFLFLAVDEITTIHERIGAIIKEALNTSGFLFYAWVIPYGIAFVIFLMAYAKFVFNLPKETMVLFILSGCIFIAGAFGFEVFSARQADIAGWGDLTYAILYSFEELFEKLGIALFIYALLRYISTHIGSISIQINESHS